jgi:hypothetical protein
MKKRTFGAGVAVLFMTLFISVSALAQELDNIDAGGFSDSTRNLLIGLGAVLLILIITFVVLLLKPKKNVPAQPGPETQPETRKNEGLLSTVVIPMPATPGDETQLLQNSHAELLVEQGIDKGAVFTISKNTNNIGRSGARINDIVLTDNTVSKVQATLYFDPASNCYSLVNEGTKNPTKVNGVLAGKRVLLGGGDLIEMGKTALRFKLL